MNILYIALKYDYGRKERGYSFEHYNFYDSLVKMDDGKHVVTYFPFDEIMDDIGKEKMNDKLLKKVLDIKPDLCFFFLFTDEISLETIKKISQQTKTFNWFADDHWRFHNFSKHLAPLFTYVSTTDSQTLDKYHTYHIANVIKTQWACNHFLYKPHSDIYKKIDYKYDISFVGQSHGIRKKFISHLIKMGLSVNCFGSGWSNGKISQDNMIDVFCHSKINLNLTEASKTSMVKNIFKIVISYKNNKYRLNKPYTWLDNVRSYLRSPNTQIKGRNFEVPGSGGLLCTQDADNLSEYYIDGKEVLVFKNTKDMIDKITYYLHHEDERIKIVQAGYERTLDEHTYEKRFQKIFSIMKLPGYESFTY